jgi:mRNA interferase MazF
MNAALPRVLIAPIIRSTPRVRPEVNFQEKSARILLDQLCSVDKSRLAGRMGAIPLPAWHGCLLEMLA